MKSRPRLALAAVVGLYLALGSVYLVTTPALEKPDEHRHLAYILYLLDHRELPPITPDEVANPAMQEAGQPPLFYGLAAGLAQLSGIDRPRPILEPNPYWAYPVPGTTSDNKNLFVHPPGELALPQFRIVYALRAFSLACGAAAVVAAYGLARALSLQDSLALAAALFVAVLPQYSFIASGVTNDALVTALCAVALWALVRALRGTDVRRWLVFGALAGLASLSKVSALVLLPLGVAGALWIGYRHQSRPAAGVGALVSVGGPLLFSGWWYAHNLLLYHDPLGLSVHFAKVGREASLSAVGLLGQWQGIETSFWAAFGWSNVTLPAWAYWVFRAAEALAVVGLTLVLRGRLHKRDWHVSEWVVLLYVAAIGAALMWWTSTVSGSLGRLLFPALAPLAVVMVSGWARVWSRLPAVILSGIGILAAVSPAYIIPAYAPPRLLAPGTVPSGAQPTHIEFGQLARLYAFGLSSHRARPGDSVYVTLCWEALATTGTNYSVFVHFLGPADTIVGDRNTYPGLGAYATSLWHVGDAFCDAFSVPVKPYAPGPAVYGVEIGVFDLATGQRLPATDENGNHPAVVTVDQLKVLGPGAAVPAGAVRLEFNFADQVSLLGWEAGDGHPGGHAVVTLYWQARRELPLDYTIFLHVVDGAGRLVAQGDAPPQAGRYPTRWWDPGETVADPHEVSLPADLPPGEYLLRAGLYRPETGERLPLVGAAGDAVDLGVLRVVR